MNEKSLLIGHSQKVKRILPEALMRTQKLLGFDQGGVRDRVAFIAKIRADSRSLLPVLSARSIQCET